MNAREVAMFLDLHPNTVYNMIRDGEIEAFKKGRSYEIPREEVERLLSKQDIDRDVEKEMAIKELMLEIDLEMKSRLHRIHEVYETIEKYSDDAKEMKQMIKHAKRITDLENIKEELQARIDKGDKDE